MQAASVREVSHYDVVLHVVSPSDALEYSRSAAGGDWMLTASGDFSDKVRAIPVRRGEYVVRPERAGLAVVQTNKGLGSVSRYAPPCEHLADQIDRRRPDYHHITYEFAQIYAINGNHPEAVKWLRETSETGNPSYEMFARDPFLDKIRQSPEYIEFMAELKLEYNNYRNEFH